MKLEINLPSRISEIRLSQYQDYIRKTKDIEDNELINKIMVSVFCRIPMKYIDHIKQRDYEDILQHFTLIFKELETKPLKREVRYNGVNYGFIPNLDDITVGEQADIIEYINDIQYLDKALKVLYRPITIKKFGKYQVEEYKGEGGGLDMPLDVAMGARFFFVNLTRDLLKSIPNYIKNQAEQTSELKSLEKNGVGINQYMELLKATYLSLQM